MKDPYEEGAQLTWDLSVRDVAIEAPWHAPVYGVPHAPLPELLAMLLGPSTLEDCRRLLADPASLRNAARVFPRELQQMGFNRTHIEKLAAVFEVARRFGEEEFVPGQPFRGSYDIYAHFRERLAEAAVEFFIVVLLDSRNHKLRDVIVSQGSLTSSIVHPRDVFLPVIRHSAASVIFVHNHPSGDPTPSQEDLDITRRLREAGTMIGVRVLDHVVIGRGRYVSFVDEGYW